MEGTFDIKEFWERQKNKPFYRAPADNRIKNNLSRERKAVYEKLEPIREKYHEEII